MEKFAGRWLTSFGPMTLRAESGGLAGTYGPTGAEHQIRGVVERGHFKFGYREPHEHGTGWFRLRRHGRFTGEYLAQGAEGPRPWRGERLFDGVWLSSFGPMRLVQDETRVHGYYGEGGGSRIDGQIVDNRLVFRFEERETRGEAWFELDESGTALAGEFRNDGATDWCPWGAQRQFPERGLTWLVVLESPWQHSLAANEFAFGNMLREIFARVPGVAVRHRYFEDEAGLLRRCRDLSYLPEPVVLVITCHGEPDGLRVHGTIIDTARIIDGLKFADSLELLHFSTCLVGQDEMRALGQTHFPVSGYATSVGWSTSALIEFVYLDMILDKGLTPARAAEQLTLAVPFAGATAAKGSPYAAAGFRYFSPADADHAIV